VAHGKLEGDRLQRHRALARPEPPLPRPQRIRVDGQTLVRHRIGTGEQPGHQRAPDQHAYPGASGWSGKTKGPAVCAHRTAYRQERLEGAVLAKFREAMTAPMIDALARMVNTQLEAVFQGYGARTAELAGEIERLEGQASHLVQFLATGGDSPAVRAELRTIETTLVSYRAEWATLASSTGERQAEISGRAKSDSLLRSQEAVCLQVVAGARSGLWTRPLKFDFLITY